MTKAQTRRLQLRVAKSLLIAIALVLTTEAMCSDRRNFDLRSLNWTNQPFTNHLEFLDDRTLIVGFEVENPIAGTVKPFNPNDATDRQMKYELVAIDFATGRAGRPQTYFIGWPIVVALNTGNFIFSDRRRLAVMSRAYEEIASSPLPANTVDVTASSDRRTVLVTVKPPDSEMATVTALDPNTLRSTSTFEIPSGKLGATLVDRNRFAAVRLPSPEDLVFGELGSSEHRVGDCPTHVPYLITRKGLLVDCPPLTLFDFRGGIAASNRGFPDLKNKEVMWNGGVVESADGTTVAACGSRWGGGSKFFDVGEHVTEQRVVVLDAGTLALVESIPIKSHKSSACRVALSPDGSKLAILHDGVITLLPVK